MVSLGFIRNSEHCPSTARQVRVLQSRDPLPETGEATVRIWREAEGATRWGLDWTVGQKVAPEQWAPSLAARIIRLGWDVWWLDVACLSRAMNLSAGKALEAWGVSFWPAYTVQALVFLDVGQQRREIYQTLRRWQDRFAWVCFSSGHDFDNQPPARGKIR
jgi:hypothetical protein